MMPSSLKKGLVFAANLDEWSMENGDNLVVNGGFDTDSVWAKGDGWSISSGKARGLATYSYFAQDGIIAIGKKYVVTFVLSDYVLGSLALDANTGVIPSVSSNGNYSYQFTAISTSFAFRGTSFQGSIDNVVVREVSAYTLDKVSGAKGVCTDVFPVLDKHGNGRRSYSLNGSSSYFALPSMVAFGTSDFTVIRKVKVGALGAVRTLIGGLSDCFELHISATGYLTAVKFGGVSLIASTQLLSVGSVYSLGYSRSGTTGTYWVNGVACGTCVDANDYSVACTLGGKGSGYFNGDDYMLRVLNYSASPSDIAYYSKPENPIKYEHRGVGANKNILDLNAEGMTADYWYDRTNSLTATNSGCTLVKPSASNLGAMAFNGSTSKVVFSGMDGLTGDITVAFWVNPIELPNFHYHRLINNTKLMLLLADSGNKLSFTRDGSTYLTTVNDVLALNEWVHIVITSTNTGVSKMYINGVESPLSGSGAGTPVSNTSLNIATDENGLNGLIGIFDSVMIWKQILSSEQALTLSQIN